MMDTRLPLQDAAVALYRRLQNEVCAALEAREPSARFRRDTWDRPGGGGGESRVLEGGDFLEKGGVSFSEVHGELPADFARTLPGTGTAFWAAGTSLVLHPRNPYVPTVHANFRMLRQGDVVWFGGGADLTPYYPFEEDARHFHRAFKTACDAHDPSFHATFKAACDRYFYLPHRKEARGLGGIFFDHLTPSAERTGEALLDFQTDAADAFLKAFLPIVDRRNELAYGPRERDFQAWRRGRYVEFNLMHDKGTLFGLRTDGRVESILMSLPPVVAFRYDWRPEPGSPEARIFELLSPRDWAGDGSEPA